MHHRANFVESQNGPITVLVDDTRAFRERRPHRQVRHPDDAVALLEAIGRRRLPELWLDFDLLGGTTSEPLVDFIEDAARQGAPLNIGTIFVHSARVPEGLHMTWRLRQAGYAAQRSYAQHLWVRFDPAVHHEWRRPDGRVAGDPNAVGLAAGEVR